MIHLLSIVIPLLSFSLQSYPRFFNRYFGVDVWTRLLEIEHVRKADHKIPSRIKKGFIIDGYFDYPIIFPWIFSFFSKKFLLKIQGFVSPFFDMLQNILVYAICYQLTENVAVSLLSQLIYSLIPIIPIENSYLTPRSLGYLNFTLAFYPLMMFHINHNLSYLMIGFLFSTTLFLVHRFALQSLLFISVFFTFVDKSPFYILSFLLSFLTATIITKGYYLRVLRGHLYNIFFWVKNYKFRFAHQIYGNTKPKKRDLIVKIYPLLSTLSPLLIVATNIWILSAFIYLYIYTFHIPNFPKNIVFFKMSIWIIFFYAIGSIILKIKKLIPIGEGQRYLEMASVPSAILSSITFYYAYRLWVFPVVLIFLLLALGNISLIFFIQIKGIIKDKNRSLTKDLANIYAYINKLPTSTRIICIPHQITTMTVYNTKANVLVNADNKGLMRIMDIYPILKKPIAQLKEEYNLHYLLLRESFASLKDLKLQKAKIQFRAGDIALVRLNNTKR